MIRTIFTISYLLFVALFASLHAQEIWSLQKCVDYAIDNNIKIKQGVIATEYQKNQLKQTKFSRLPNLSGQMSQNLNFGRSLTYDNTYKDINSSQTDFGIGTNVPVFQGFIISNNISKLELDLQASIEDLSKAKSDISVNIASTFLEILFAKDLVKVSEDQLTVTNLQIKQITEKVDAGSLARGSLLEIEAQAAGEELNLVNAQNQLKIARLRLTQLLELPANDDFDVEVPALPEISAEASIVSAGEVYKSAVLTRPEIKGADLRYQSSQYQLKMAQGALYPTISLYANIYDSYNNKYTDVNGASIAFSDQLKNNQRKGIGAQMNIPIFTRFANKIQIDNARLQVLNTELELENTKKLLRSDIETAQTSAIAALNRFNSNQKAVSSMREAFRYSEEKFGVGLVNAVEYNTAKTKLAKSESDLLQAKYEFIFRTKILDFYRGLPLTL
ncbi:MAG TPA: TolC family protein [Prolixibacteraceae bacterium]|nr:TolC family protein [Prolixibacteraceae bacterium]